MRQPLSRLIAGCLCMLSTLVGCDAIRSDPETIEVVGTVFTNKGVPVPGGFVEFEGVIGGKHKGLAEINSDGSFSMRTALAGGRFLNGIPEGIYRCTIRPVGQDADTPGIRLPQSYKVNKDMKQPLLIMVPHQRAVRTPG